MAERRALLGRQMTALAVTAGLAVLVGSGAAHAQAPAPPAPAFEAMEMRAQLAPQRFTTLSAEIPAKVNRLSRRDGDSIAAGDVLVEFDCALQDAQLDKARAHQTASDTTLEGLRSLYKLNAVGLVEVKTGEAEVLKARADVAYLRAMMAKCRIVAPFDGRVAEHQVREQQFVQAGQPLVEVIDDSALELDFLVPSRWLGWLRPDHVFSVLIEDTGREYPARLLRTGARVDPVSQTVRAVAVIDGTFPELISGMSGQILLTPPSH